MGALGDWITTKEAAAESGYHRDHIKRLIRAGAIDARKWGNAWMVSRESLLRYMALAETKGEKRGPRPEK